MPAKRRVDELQDALEEIIDEHSRARKASQRNLAMIAGLARPATNKLKTSIVTV